MPHAFINTGYKPPAPEQIDKRNFTLEKAQAIAPFPVKHITDISHIPVFDQQKIPDCVENAITLVKSFHDFMSNKQLISLARRFLAIETVKKDGFPLDNGTNIQNALYVAHKEGICETTELSDNHDMRISDFANPAVITAAAFANGLTHTIYSYAFVSDKSINGLKNAIYQNGLVLVGGVIDENWWTAANGQISWDKKDIYPIRPPKPNSLSKSNHAFVLYGYDEGGFYLRNSFGNEWADNGNNYIPNAAMGIIYEAATIIDLTPEQIAIQRQLSQVGGVVHNLDPKNPNYKQILVKLMQVTQIILKEIGLL